MSACQQKRFSLAAAGRAQQSLDALHASAAAATSLLQAVRDEPEHPAQFERLALVPAQGGGGRRHDVADAATSLEALWALTADASPADPAVQLSFWRSVLDATAAANMFTWRRLQRVCDAFDAWLDRAPILWHLCGVLRNFCLDCPTLGRHAATCQLLLSKLLAALNAHASDMGLYDAVAMAGVALLYDGHSCDGAEVRAVADALLRQPPTEAKFLFYVAACGLPRVAAAVRACGGLLQLSREVQGSGGTPGAVWRQRWLRMLRNHARAQPERAGALLDLGAAPFAVAMAGEPPWDAPGDDAPRLAVHVLFCLVGAAGARDAMLAAGALPLCAHACSAAARSAEGSNCTTEEMEAACKRPAQTWKHAAAGQLVKFLA